jgi:membrane protease YdiL (CAAX protease family)
MTDLAPDSREAPAAPAFPPPEPAAPRLSRGRAFLEVVLCSSYPTQLVVAGTLAAAGIQGLKPDGALNAPFVIAVAVGDALLVAALIAWFIRRNGESMHDVFVARQPLWREVAFGIVLAPAVLRGISLVVAGLRALVPSLHNVPTNPMGALMRDPVLAGVFAVVVVLAGGVREELQRGFQLHRLTGYVCGRGPALLLTSVAFGAGHTLQGLDVAVATGVLGAFWSLLYLARGSIVAAAVSHGLFNLGQVVIAYTLGDALAPGP